jgi:hypothetical protein
MTAVAHRTRPLLRVGGVKVEARPMTVPGLDPDVFPPNRAMDYEAVAETSWYTALLWAGAMTEDDTALAALAEREDRCRAWLMAHDATHPQWTEAQHRRVVIENEESSLGLGRRVHARACWVACCEVYAALCHLLPFERQSWSVEFVSAQPVTHPSDVWALLRGDEPAAGQWPLAKDEAVIEGRLTNSPTWQRHELRTVGRKRGR